jgi:hypothetical protein
MVDWSRCDIVSQWFVGERLMSVGATVNFEEKISYWQKSTTERLVVN